MKKTLIVTLALVFVLGIAGTAFAATNPFVDVPAKHWAYGSITQLANAGIIDGYGDGTFRGDQLMTRYEMAQIVAKAMAKSDKANAEQKAMIDKLATEFAAELNNLGVRVSNLEKNQSSVKISADARLRFVDNGAAGDAGSAFHERFRLNMNAKVNDSTTFYGRFMALNHNEFGKYNNNNDKVNLVDAAFTTKNFLGVADVTVGRFSQMFGQSGYLMNTVGGVDGIKATFGNQLKFTAGYANFDPYAGIQGLAAGSAIEDAYFGELSYAFSKATKMSFSMINEVSGASSSDYDNKEVGLTIKFAKDWMLQGDYGRNYAAVDDPKFYVARLQYGNAVPSKVNSWSLAGEYRYFDLNSTVPAFTGAMIPVANVKGYAVIGSYTLAKNIVLDAFYAFNGETVSAAGEVPAGTEANDYTRVQVNFMF